MVDVQAVTLVMD